MILQQAGTNMVNKGQEGQREDGHRQEQVHVHSGGDEGDAEGQEVGALLLVVALDGVGDGQKKALKPIAGFVCFRLVGPGLGGQQGNWFLIALCSIM